MDDQLSYPPGSIKELSELREGEEFFVIIVGKPLVPLITKDVNIKKTRYVIGEFRGINTWRPSQFNVDEVSCSKNDHNDFAFKNYWDAYRYLTHLTRSQK